ncbi:hypothetical protein [Aestuariirhabdus sp. LZHN29]|uniref:hypothetical protein n=1 Tax=Aestuariirhabdus sp. LZHN29 TaxID=3417462 RepID=UPI003CF4B230
MSQRAHGQYSVTSKDAIIVLRLVGSFNEYSVQGIFDDVKAAVASLGCDAFAILIDARDYGGATPEALEVGNRYNIWLNENGLVAKAMILDASLVAEISHQNMEAVREQNVRKFSQQDAASSGSAPSWQNQVCPVKPVIISIQ